MNNNDSYDLNLRYVDKLISIYRQIKKKGNKTARHIFAKFFGDKKFNLGLDRTKSNKTNPQCAEKYKIYCTNKCQKFSGSLQQF